MSILKELKSSTTKCEIEDLYKKLGTIKKIAEHFNTSQQTISRLFDHYSIKRNKNIGNKKHNFNEDYFENIDNEEKAYWLGFLMADGCVYKGTGNSYRLQINLKYDDVGHLRKFQSTIGSDYSIQRKEINNSVAALLKINSTKMCNDLIKHGVIERKSKICILPEIDKCFYRHFIRGYFDGDGCIKFTINDRARTSFSIVCGEDMANSFSEILGIKKRYIRNDLFEVYTANRKKILEIYDTLYKDSKVYLQRKKKCYDILVYVLNCPLME